MARTLYNLLQASQPRPETASPETSASLEKVQRESFERWLHDPVTIQVIQVFVKRRDDLRTKLEKDSSAVDLDDRQIRTTLLQVSALSDLIETLQSNE